MRNSGKSVARLALATACLGAIGAVLLPGCKESDSRQADRVIDKSIEQSVQKRELGGEGAKTALASLQTAAGATAASFGEQIRAKTALAAEEVSRALALVPVISREDLDIDDALAQARQAGAQMVAAQRAGASYGQLDPADVLKQIDANRTAAKTSMEKAKAEGAAAQAEIDKRQQEINGLKEERKKSEADAEALTEKSGTLKGEEAGTVFKQAIDARIKAGILAAQIETKTEAMLPFQRTAAIAQQQMEFWTSANKDKPGAMQQIDESQQQVGAMWQETQAQMQAQAESAKKIFAAVISPGKDNDQPNAGSRLVKLIADTEKNHAEAAKLLTDAVKHYGEAAAAADKLHAELQAKINDPKGQTAAELPAWKGLLSLYDKQQYVLQKGVAQNRLADFQSNQAAQQKHMKMSFDALAKIAQGSGLQLPKEFTSVDFAKTAEAAIASYKAAEETLEPLSRSTLNTDNLPLLKQSALLALLHARVCHYRLAPDEATQTAYNLDKTQAEQADAKIELPASLRELPK